LGIKNTRAHTHTHTHTQTHTRSHTHTHTPHSHMCLVAATSILGGRRPRRPGDSGQGSRPGRGHAQRTRERQQMMRASPCVGPCRGSSWSPESRPDTGGSSYLLSPAQAAKPCCGMGWRENLPAIRFHRCSYPSGASEKCDAGDGVSRQLHG
jgi:hypothetical protein